MSGRRTVPLGEIERRVRECLRKRFLTQRELAREYQKRYHLRGRAFLYHIARLVRALNAADPSSCTVVRYRVGKEFYWCRAKDRERWMLEVSGRGAERARELVQVFLDDPGSLRPVRVAFARFFRAGKGGRLEPLRLRASDLELPYQKAWVPGELKAYFRRRGLRRVRRRRASGRLLQASGRTA